MHFNYSECPLAICAEERELADVLFDISLVSSRLARKLTTVSDSNNTTAELSKKGGRQRDFIERSGY